MIGRRPLVALLAGALTALGAFSVQSTLATGVLGDLVPGARVTNIAAVVDKDTPLFQVDVHFTLQGVNCTTMPLVELHWEMRTTGIGTDNGAGQPVDTGRGDNNDKVALCAGGKTGPLTDFVVNRPMWGSGWQDAYPNEVLQIWGEVRQQGTAKDGSVDWPPEQANLPDGSPAINTQFNVQMPNQPVWVGVGDGYSSAVQQSLTTCAITTPPAPGCVNLNNYGVSWVAAAVDQANSKFRVRSAWKIQYVPLANVNETAAALKNDADTQLQQMRAQLGVRAPKPGQPGSWNWVGVTAGLVDAGINQALLDTRVQTITVTGTGGTFTVRFKGSLASVAIPFNATAAVVQTALSALSTVLPGDLAVTKSGNVFTVTFGGQWANAGNSDVPLLQTTSLLTGGGAGAAVAGKGWYFLTGNSPAGGNSPWDVGTTQANQVCPTYPAMTMAVSTDIKAGLLNVVQEALGADPNVRVVHPLYPYWAEAAGGNPGYTNPCRASVATFVDALDGAASLTGTPGVVDVDWRAFDPAPTGTGTGTNREGSVIHLAKPYGFPYLADNGAGRGAALVIAAIAPVRPDEDYTFARGTDTGLDFDAWDGASEIGWWNKPVDVQWTGIDNDSNTRVPLPTTHVTSEGHLVDPGPPYCKPTATGKPLCANPAPADVFTDFTPPVMGATISGASNNTWYNASQPISIHWDTLRDDPGLLDDGSGAVSGIDSSTDAPDIDVTTEGGGQTFQNADGTGCDIALNCRTFPVSVNVDLTPPTYSHSISGTANGLGWYKTPPTVTWTVGDQPGLSGPDVAPAPFTPTGDGTFTVGPTAVYDRAGNKSIDPAFTIKVDSTKPVVTFLVDGNPTVSGASIDNPGGANGQPDAGCTAVDPGGAGASGYVSGTCTIAPTGAEVLPNGGGTKLTYRITATDRAGNVTTQDVSVTVPAGTTVLLPPTVTGGPTTLANGDNWYDAPVTFTWTPARGIPGNPLAVSSLPNTVVGTDGTAIPVTSPAVCDISVPPLCATALRYTVNLDQVKPTIAPFPGITPGGTYYFTNAPAQPVTDCGSLAIDDRSGVKSCVATTTFKALPSSGIPGFTYTTEAVATDRAGNSSTRAVSWTVYTVVPANGGRMTGGGSVTGSSVKTQHAGTEVLIVATSPAAGSVVTGGSAVSATYDDETKIGTSGIYAPSVTVTGPSGPVAVVLDPFTASTHVTLTAKLPASLPDGLYTVSFKAWDTDQNKPGGDFDIATWQVRVGAGTTPSSSGPVKADFTLRCNGSPNNLAVQWSGGSFDLDQVTKAVCWDDPNVDPEQPRTPIDTYYATGTGLFCRSGSFTGHDSYDDGGDDEHQSDTGGHQTGDDKHDKGSDGKYRSSSYDSGHGNVRSSKSSADAKLRDRYRRTSSGNGSYSGNHDDSMYTQHTQSGHNEDSGGNRCNGHDGKDGHDSHGSSSDCVDATIEWKFIDGGEPGGGVDQLWIVIKDNTGKVVLDTTGTIDSGNFQAHDSQGNGTNNNGNLNGPNGHNPSAPTTVKPAKGGKK